MKTKSHPKALLGAALILLMLSLQGCYFGKQLDKAVTVRVESNFTPVNSTTIPEVRYVNNHTLEEYKQACLSRLETSLGVDNVTVLGKGDTRSADYIIVFESLTLTEGTKTETVSDEDSEFNGQTYELSTCDATGSAKLMSADRSETLDSWTVYADKAEKVKNNRTLGQLITGSNQDNNTYREKLLSDGVFVDLSGKIGNRISAKITNRIHKIQK